MKKSASANAIAEKEHLQEDFGERLEQTEISSISRLGMTNEDS